eukprot:403358539
MESFDIDDDRMSLDQKYNEQHFMQFIYFNLQNNIRQLLQCLEDVLEIDERNQLFIVEVIRNLSEFVVYSEKFKKNYFDIFCEKNTLESFVKILNMNNRFANMQLIQTNYILSHPFLNKLISFNFNFYDEELVDVYISFLKSLALQINNDTIRFFFNQRFNNFPLFAIAIQFYNHPEMMVRNAIRIITLTIFKLNDEQINSLLSDLPFCYFFPNLACYFKDKILELEQSHIPKQSENNKSNSQEQLNSYVEELQDLMEFMQEIFEVDNQVINDMLANCLLHYCYLPVVLGSLVSVSQKPLISINTAQYTLIQTFMNLKYQPLINTIVASLLLHKLPVIIKNQIECTSDLQKQATSYRFKWMMKLPNYYTTVKFVQQNYNESCFEQFLEDTKYHCLKTIQEKITQIDPEIRYDQDNRSEFNKLLYITIKECLEELQIIEEDHFGISQALGFPVGLVKAKLKLNEQLYKQVYDNIQDISFNSLVDVQHQLMIDIITNNSETDYTENLGRSQFLNFLKSKDDNLILLTNSTIYTILTISKVSPSLLFKASLYPIGFRRKNLLLQKLINTTDTDSLELSPRKKQKHENQKSQQLEILELNHQKQLLEACNGIIYDQEVVETLLNLLSNEPPFRMITFKVICSILIHLTYNKKLICSLHQQHVELIKQCYILSIQNLYKILQNPQIAEILPEFFEEEWMKFKFVEQQEIDNLITDPLIMLPTLDEKQLKRIPNALMYPSKDHEIIRMRIKIFLSLRHMIFTLLQNDGSIIQKTRENPMKKDERETQKWIQGNSYEISANNELILCNIMQGSKKVIRYVLVDQDFLILIEPEVSNTEYKVKVHLKVPLKFVESMIDKREPSNLNMGYAIFQKNSARPQVEESLLYFENTHKCSYVKNKLDASKKSSKQTLINRVALFLEKCTNEASQDN